MQGSILGKALLVTNHRANIINNMALSISTHMAVCSAWPLEAVCGPGSVMASCAGTRC